MNTALLEYEMKRNGYTAATLSKEIGISLSAFYKKCNGKSEFRQKEIAKIVAILKLKSPVDIFLQIKFLLRNISQCYGVFVMTIYERIKSLRLALGMSQAELAKKVGYEGRSAISKVESGERDISQSMIELYAKALNVPPIYLLYGNCENQSTVSKSEIHTKNNNQKEHIMKRITTDEAVEREIATLLEDKDVQLAKAEQRAKYKRRQYLYTLRYLQKRGKELREAGITKEAFTNLSKTTEKDLEDVEN